MQTVCKGVSCLFTIINLSIHLKHISHFCLRSLGVKWFLPQEEACRGERWRDWLTRHPGGGENRGLKKGDDRVETAAGERTFSQDESGRTGDDNNAVSGVWNSTDCCGLNFSEILSYFLHLRCGPWMPSCTQRSWRQSPSSSRSSRPNRRALSVCSSTNSWRGTSPQPTAHRLKHLHITDWYTLKMYAFYWFRKIPSVSVFQTT